MKAITKYLGNFGRYQAYVYALLFFPGAISGAQTMIFAFIGAIPNARCRTSADGPLSTYETGFNNSQVKYGGEKTGGGMKQYCEYCVKTEFDNCTLQYCDHGFIYDRTQFHSSLAMEFDMVCDGAWKRELANSMFMVGVLFGATIFGSLADRFGRKPVFVVCGLMHIISFNIIYFVHSYPLFCFIHLCNGAIQHGTFLTGFTLIMELAGGLARTICGVWVHGFFAVGYVYVGFMAIFIRDWRWLQFSVSIWCLLYIPFYWLLPESIRWLTVKGHKEEAKRVFLNAAKWNKVTIDEKTLDQELTPEVNGGDQSTVVQLFTNGWGLARTTLTVFFSWFVVSMVYFGLSQNTSDLPGDVYTTYILSGLIELPGYVICVPMMEYLGRKYSLVVSFAICGISCVVSGFIPHSYSIMVIITAVIGKMFAAACFAFVFNYSAEVYPTVVRNGGTGMSSGCARIGSIAAPLIHLLNFYVTDWLAIVVYGGFAVAAAVADLWLPETKNRELPETINDGIIFNQRRSKKKKSASANTKLVK